MIDIERFDEVKAKVVDRPELVMERIQGGDLALLHDVARLDVLPNLLTWFTPRDEGWLAVEERSGPTTRSAACSEWSYTGTHDVDGAFNGLAASGREVTVRGVTMVSLEDVDDDRGRRLRVRRYVDWAGLYAQLHLSVSWRVPL